MSQDQHEASFEQAWDELTSEGSVTGSDTAAAVTDAAPAQDTAREQVDASEQGSDTAKAEDSQATAGDVAPKADQQGDARTETGTTGEPLDEAAQLRQQLADLQLKLTRQSGQVAGYERKHQKLLEEKREAEHRLKRIKDLGEDTEDPEKLLEQLEKDYPDIAGPLRKIVRATNHRIEAVSSTVQEQVTPIISTQQRDTMQRAVDLVLSVHPDARDVVTSTAYREWLGQQHPDVRVLQHSPNPEHGIELISAFKAQQSVKATGGQQVQEQTKPEDKANRLTQLVQPATTRRGQPRSALPPDDFDAAWDYYSTNT